MNYSKPTAVKREEKMPAENVVPWPTHKRKAAIRKKLKVSLRKNKKRLGVDK
jgi:hypothetical protein